MRGITKVFSSVFISGLFGAILGIEFNQHEILREFLAYTAVLSLSGFSGYVISKAILKL